MKIAGCDFRPRWQQIAVFERETEEITDHKLRNSDGHSWKAISFLTAVVIIRKIHQIFFYVYGHFP